MVSPSHHDQSEADTCRTFVLPKLRAAGWTDDQIVEQKYFTDGRITIVGRGGERAKGKRADYLLRLTPDFTLAVVEAKAAYKQPADGLQQAKDYAQSLDLRFAYSTNGKGIVEHDFLSGRDTPLKEFPTAAHLWSRLRKHEKLDEATAGRLLTPTYPSPKKKLRYYQEIAVNRAVEAILKGRSRVLLTMATGTGKTFVAFQIIWKLWSARWNRTGSPRQPRVLYLADRAFLVDKPKDLEFAPFNDARARILGEAQKSRQIYFATYQALAGDGRTSLYREFAPDFFDLIVVDECHRGSASDESNWRDILDHFAPAFKLGMTATPRRDDNVDTYKYFEAPVYEYSLKQGIEDGFLAPYRVHRVVPSVDAAGWRPSPGETDRHGREIPDKLYRTPQFERELVHGPRTEAIARHLTDYLKKTSRYDKTIIFCVDQDHAEAMRMALNNLNTDLVAKHPNYTARITAIEGDIGKGHLEDFADVEKETPVLVTTSRLLTTGIDVPTCKNIAIVRMVNSMTEFKQIIGRGTRVREDYGKMHFTILDYTGSATRLFADPDFDGQPAWSEEETMDGQGKVVARKVENQPPLEAGAVPADAGLVVAGEGVDQSVARGKYYLDRGGVEIVQEVVSDLDATGKQMTVTQYTNRAGETVRTLYRGALELQAKWSLAEERDHIVAELERRGVSLAKLAEAAGRTDADPFDLLCHVAFSLPIRTRKERAARIRTSRADLLARYSAEAREILGELLDRYEAHGPDELRLPEALKVPPLDRHGTVEEIARRFGGADRLRAAVSALQEALYVDLPGISREGLT